MSERISDYKIVYVSNGAEEKLRQLVIDAISQGWEPLGGVGVQSDEGHPPGLYQAMIKREPSN